MRNSAISAVIAATLLGALALGGCSASSGGASGADSGGANSAVGHSVAQGPEGGQAAAAAPDAPRPAAAGSGASAVDAKVMLTPPALVRTATLSVRVAKPAAVNRQADAAGRIATAAGGSVYADDRTSGKHATARLTLKVPPSSLDTVLDRLAHLGTATSRTSSTEDVTTQVVDVASRVISARDSLTRLRALYGKATKVRDVIAIENEITERESDLESLQAQQRALSGRTELATVHFRLSTAAVPPPPAKPARTGFVGGLDHGWHAFTASVGALVTAFGAVLPFLVVLLVAASIAWWVRHRVRDRHRPPAPSPAE